MTSSAVVALNTRKRVLEVPWSMAPTRGPRSLGTAEGEARFWDEDDDEGGSIVTVSKGRKEAVLTFALISLKAQTVRICPSIFLSFRPFAAICQLFFIYFFPPLHLLHTLRKKATLRHLERF